MNSRSEIKTLTMEIKTAIEKEVAGEISGKYWILHYGANDIHPRYLVYWICVQSDAEKRKLRANKQLMKRLRSILDEYDYPEEGRNGVHIGLESQETVDRDSSGSWFYHFK